MRLNFYLAAVITYENQNAQIEINIIRIASRCLFATHMIDKVCKHLVSAVAQSEQCDSFFKSGGSMSDIAFWDSDGNLFADERFLDPDGDLHIDGGFDCGLCFDSEACCHVFLDGAGAHEVLLNGTLSEEGSFDQADRLFRVGREACLQKPKCKAGYELFAFAVDDDTFSLKSSKGMIVDKGHITDREGENKHFRMDLALARL